MNLSPVRERAVLGLLVVVQVCQMVDFMIAVPLGSQLMRELAIGPAQFGLLLAVYAMSAAIAGFGAAMVVDRFDRRRTLLLLYGGFGVTALVAGLAPGYGLLLATRVFAGAFGGVLGGTVLAIVSDIFPAERRGRALATVLSAFSMVLIMGLPFSITLATWFGWRAPYLALAAICLLSLPLCVAWLPPVQGHIAAGRERGLGGQMRGIFRDYNHRLVLVFQFIMVFSGFILMSFVATYLVENVGVAESQLAICYVFGGIAALASGQIAGRMIERVGRQRVFAVMMLGSCVGALVATHFPPAPLWAAVLLLMYLYSFFGARQVPAMSIVTSGIAPAVRGGVLSINASLQQLALGLASFVASAVVGRGPDGELTHYGTVGIISVAMGLSALWIARRIRAVDRPAASGGFGR